MEALAQTELKKQSMYGSEHPCVCVPSEYCFWQCLCEPDENQKMEEKINVSSGEDAFV